MIANNFSHCSKSTNFILFKSLFQISTFVVFGYRIEPTCEQLRYTYHAIAYNKAYRILMNYKRQNSASLML